MKEDLRPSYGMALFIVLQLLFVMGASILWLDIPIHVAMFIVLFITVAALMKSGFTWDFIMDSIGHGGKMIMETMLILMVIGMIMGSWLASGTVPAIIYWGLKLINPNMFLVTSCLVCAVVALATGSSWSTVGTVGVALIAVGNGLEIPIAMTAGAIVSGAFFGDKMSPLSDTTNLAPAMAEGDLFDHIKAMFYTTIPGLAIALVAYWYLGQGFGADNLDVAVINDTLNGIQSHFSMNFAIWIPPIMVLGFALLRIPALISLSLSALVAAIIAVVVQGHNLAEITTFMNSGYVSEIGIDTLDALLTRGGIDAMAPTVTLTLIGLPLGTLLERTNVLSVLLERMQFITRSAASLVTGTILTCVGINLTTASQYLSIVLTGRLYLEAYKEHDLLPQTLSRSLEDSGTLTSALIPWNLCAMFIYGAIGVGAFEYLPYAVFNWATPLIAIIFAQLGLFQWRTGDIPSVRTYREVEA